MCDSKFDRKFVDMDCIGVYTRESTEVEFDKMAKRIVDSKGTEVEKILCLQNLMILDILRTMDDDFGKAKDLAKRVRDVLITKPEEEG